MLTANYGSGSVACIPIGDDGKLAPPSSSVQHKGTSVDKKRQEGPHAHSINLDAANKFAFACDLGLDKVLVYKFDSATGKLTPVLRKTSSSEKLATRRQKWPASRRRWPAISLEKPIS